MNYKIDIEFTKNSNKAGKLTLRDENGNVVLNKVPVAVPLGSGITFQKNNLTHYQLDKYVEDPSYPSKLQKALDSYLRHSIRVSGKEPVIISQRGNDKLVGDKKLFVLKEESFLVLAQALRGNTAVMNVEQVGFLWLPEKVVYSELDKNSLLKELYELESNPVKKSSVKVEKDTVSSSVFPQKDKILKNGSPLDKKTPVQPQVSNKVVSPTNTEVRNQSVHRFNDNNDDSIDPFDVLFMHSYPELAPYYRPNSLLAWMLFMNNNNDISKSYVQNNINNISGFEGVEKADFKYTEKGYSVDLYESENGEKTGSLVFENLDGTPQYKVVGPSGEETYLQQNNDGQWIGATSGGQAPDINYQLLQTDQGFVGNWNTNHTEGNTISAGFQVTPDFDIASTPYEAVKFEDYATKSYEQAPIMVDSYQATMDNSNVYVPPEPSVYEPSPIAVDTYENTNTWEPPPPPPPPPPPEDGSWYQSQDSYSRFSP